MAAALLNISTIILLCFHAFILNEFKILVNFIGTLLTISHHLYKSLDAVTESCIDQLDFSAAFDRASHSGLLFKLKSNGEGGSVLFICREFLSNRRQRVVVDAATSDQVDPNCYWRAAGKCVRSSSAHPLSQ